MAKEYSQNFAVGDYIQIKNGDTYLEYRIAGTVKDLHVNGVWSKVTPMILGYAKPENVTYLSIRFDKENATKINQVAKSKWQELFPNLPYDGYFQTEMLAETTNLTTSIRSLFIYISLIVIITAGLGLFALVSLNIVRRSKEIGIRRVLGANFNNINYLVSKEFIALLSISGVLGSLLGYFLVYSLLSSIWAYHVGFQIFPGLISVLIMTTIAFLTIGSQLLKVATTNPADSLRDE
jgi:putative ABC transport system permease protein